MRRESTGINAVLMFQCKINAGKTRRQPNSNSIDDIQEWTNVKLKAWFPALCMQRNATQGFMQCTQHMQRDETHT